MSRFEGDPRLAPAFPPTRLSVVERLRSGETETRREAFGDLVAGYWKPVYKHLRATWRLSIEDAQDLTQGLFAEAFEKEWLSVYDPSKARFRTFVRLCADRLVMNLRQSAGRLKRGGDRVTIPLAFDGAERELLLRATSVPPDAEEFFRQEFIRALFARALDEVRRQYQAAGRQVHLELFERYDLDPADGESYARLACAYGLTTTQVTNYLAQVRRCFRERALEALRSLSGSPEHFRAEARELFGLEVG